MSKEIPLTQGKVAIVDDTDFDWLNQWKWYVLNKRPRYYAARSVGPRGKQTRIYMHRFILDPVSGMEPDHINGNGLDNRRANIVACTRSEHAKIHPRGLGRKKRPV